MKKYLFMIVAVLVLFLSIGCSEDDINNPNITEDIEIQDYIWNGLNIFYLWQESVTNLADDRFNSDQEYVNFLKTEADPGDFFENLIYNRENVDKWSWIVDDYIELEKLFQGVTKNNGVEFGLLRVTNTNDVFGYVRYILPNSDASGKNIKRGDLFTHVNGTQLTLDNYRSLLFNRDVDKYTLNLSEYGSGYPFISTGISVTLTKSEYTENPVFITKTFNEDGHKIGYIMYNGFTSNFDDELNNAFLQLKNEGITDLVLDFRYNPGGSVNTAVSLASMVTGQFKGKLFTKEKWNTKLQTEIERSHPDWLINNFKDKLANGKSINSLNLSSVHIIISRSSASASELIINGLNPYINVKLIGDKTVGKYVASITLYDSDDFGKDGANPNHLYAMQPIVLEEVNNLGVNDKDGFEPHILLPEDLENLGVLGEDNEPLLGTAIDNIIGVVPKFEPTKGMEYKAVTDSKLHTILKDNMYIDKNEVRKLFKNPKVKPQ